MTAGALGGIGEMSRLRFAELYIELGRREGILLDARLDEVRFVVTHRGQEHPLQVVYERFLALPARSRRYFLMRVLRGAGGVPAVKVPSYADVAHRLLPRLRSAAYLDLVALDDKNRGRAVQSVHEPFAGELFVTVVIDGDDSMTTVTRPMLDAWGLDLSEVKRDAIDNLARVSTEPLGQLAAGFWMGPWDDAYAASRALLSSALNVCARPVVALPNRDTLLVADADVDDGLAAMVSLLESVAERGHALTRRLFTVEDGRLVDWELPHDHPSRLLHRRLAVSERVRSYSEQQWILQEAVGDDWYVATAELDETRDGAVTSRALWTEGVQALLPDVDRLHLLSASSDGTSSRMVVASMEDVRALDGALEPTDNLLARFRTVRFPTDAEIREIATPVAKDPGTAAVSEPGRRP